MAKQDLAELGFKGNNVVTPEGTIGERIDNWDQWTQELRMYVTFGAKFW